mmetsp:Transcript_6383/g.7341  ORF Transcript_6383/g.7341 Transcript_6383/m.7341 type:complete len:86 (-) Transcript_6383:339-596(-)
MNTSPTSMTPIAAISTLETASFRKTAATIIVMTGLQFTIRFVFVEEMNFIENKPDKLLIVPSIPVNKQNRNHFLSWGSPTFNILS